MARGDSPLGQRALRDFALELTKLRREAGNPSGPQLEKASGKALNTSVISELLAGRSGTYRLPPWERVLAFVGACRHHAEAVGMDLRTARADLAVWRSAYGRLVEKVEESDRTGWDGNVTTDPGPAVRPLLVGQLPNLAGYFQPRPEADELVATLAGGGAIVLGQVVTGTGGVGKTQLAARYAHTVWSRACGARGAATAGRVELVVWVNAADRQAITAAYAQAARILVPDSRLDAADADTAAGEFLTWLRSSGRRWLIVLDDVPSPATLVGLWPPEVPAGRTVVTTRSRDAAWATDTRRVLPVGVYTVEQSLTYLRRALDRPERDGHADDEAQLAGLAEDLGHLPIALAQAAAYLVDTGRSIDRFRLLLADRARTLHRILPAGDGLPDQQQRTVGVLWEISIEQADRCAPAGLARPMLELAAVLNPDGIPDRVLTGEPARRFLALHRTTIGCGHRPTGVPTAEDGVVDPLDELDAEDALRVLHRLNLIDHIPGPGSDGGGVVRVHRLVQRAVRDDGNSRLRHSCTVRSAADALLRSWPRIERSQHDAQRLRGGTAALAENDARGVLWQPGGHPVLFACGTSLGRSGQVIAAVEYFRRLADAAFRHLGADHWDSLFARRALAGWRGSAGDTGGAVRALEELVAHLLRMAGPDHPETFVTRAELGSWQGSAGDPTGAVLTLEEVLGEQVRVVGADDPDALGTRHALAGWRGHAGDPDGAVRDFELVLADRLRVLGPDHPDTLATRSSLARWRGEAGDASGAVAALEEVLADQLRVLGPDQPATLTMRNNLFYWRERADECAQTLEAVQQLLGDRLRVLGPDHPDTFASRNNVAVALGRSGDTAGAVAALEELLADQLRVLGSDHPACLTTLHNIAAWRAGSADPAGAARALEELRAGQLKVLGPEHPLLLATLDRLGHLRRKADDPVGALRVWEELLDLQIRVVGPDHPDTLMTRNNLASTRGVAGSPAEALSAFQALLPDQVRLLGADHPHSLTVRHNAAYWRGEAGDPAGAVGELIELLPDLVRVLGSDHRAVRDAEYDVTYWHELAMADPRPPAPGSGCLRFSWVPPSGAG